MSNFYKKEMKLIAGVTLFGVIALLIQNVLLNIVHWTYNGFMDSVDNSWIWGSFMILAIVISLLYSLAMIGFCLIVMYRYFLKIKNFNNLK